MLCQLSYQFPPFVESFLERSRSLRRRFREETVTDLLMGSFIIAGGRRIIVEFPDEPVTGADMEWNFTNPDDGTFFRILLQAKQCYGEGRIWTRHGYRELFHTSGRSRKLQAVSLGETARLEAATYPLYIFYHPESTSMAARAAGFNAVNGACLVDGFVIERLAVEAATRTLRTRNKSLKTIAPPLFPLSVLLCPPTILETGPNAFVGAGFASLFAIGRESGRRVIGLPVPPTPEVIRQRIVVSREMLATAVPDIADLPRVPAISERIPDEVVATIQRARTGSPSERGLQRLRVTFVSASPRDLLAELERFRRGSE
jgi:hypothetical protein